MSASHLSKPPPPRISAHNPVAFTLWADPVLCMLHTPGPQRSCRNAHTITPSWVPHNTARYATGIIPTPPQLTQRARPPQHYPLPHIPCRACNDHTSGCAACKSIHPPAPNTPKVLFARQGLHRCQTQVIARWIGGRNAAQVIARRSYQIT